MSSIYDSARLAAGYAFHRPPVHDQIVRVIAARLPTLGVGPGRRALDVGCGAGRSTAALAPLARSCVGIEPVRAMLRHCLDVAPGARFVIGLGEQLPFADASFDLVAAAGSLNYADIDRFLPAVARVLTQRGVLVVYDFAAGRQIRGDARLDEWFAAFERRFPFPPGYDIDVRQIPWRSAGLRLAAHEAIEARVPMSAESYLAYVMTETNVERALFEGVEERAIRRWLDATLRPIFGTATHEVSFDAYAAYVVRDA